MLDADFALFNVDQLVTVAPRSHPSAEGDLGVIRRAALAARGTTIVWVGPMDEFHDAVQLSPDAMVVNTHGRTVLPGFVDPHTHLVFAGDRSRDFYARALQGQDYASQLERQGIMATVTETRARSEDALVDQAYIRADAFMREGVTTVEGKTGYGLTQQDELKSLRVLNRLQHLHTLKVVPAYLAAHVVPADYQGDADAYIDDVVTRWMPEASGHASFVDVWIDEGAFTAEQARRVMSAAREQGFQVTAHANELGPGAGVQLAVEMGARSVDHVVYVDPDDVQALSGSDTVAVLLPATTLFLGSDRYAPARELLDAGASVALGTDFNPGTSNTQSMQLVLTLAVLKLHMTPEEAIRAATLEGARAVDLADRVGSLEPGKYCDLSVFTVDDYRAIPYHLGMNLVETVVSCGETVVRDGQTMTVPHPLSRPS